MLTPIEPHLFLSMTVEYAPQPLIDTKIGRVLTVATVHIPLIRRLPNVEYRHIQMADVETEELLASQKLQKALDYIVDSVNKGINMVVHCQCGISRSPTVVMAYLMRKYNWSVNDAFSYVQERRPFIQPNASFLKQLAIFEQLGYRCDEQTLRNSKIFKEFESVTKNPSKVRKNWDIYTLSESLEYSAGGKRYSCKKCRGILFYEFNVLTHNISSHGNENCCATVRKCELTFLSTPMEWMELSEHSGKIICPKCNEKIGYFNI